jgi:outer membrane protein OmpA-like peptidoglycan-associated protein
MGTIKYISLCLAIVAWQAGMAQPVSDTLSLYFELNNPLLTEKAKVNVDKWLYNDRITPNQNMLIVGYADHLGSDELNDKLSENRAVNVQNYLLDMGIDKAHIKLTVGKGEVKRSVEKADGYPTDRRVDIVLMDSLWRPRTPVVKAPPAQPVINKTLPEINISTIQPGQTLVLDKIYFHTNRHIVRDESIPELDKLYQALVNNPNVRIQVEGHVCCVAKNQDALDEDTREMALSVNRAKHICEYLVRRGISAHRLEYRGFGKSRPLVEIERTDEDEARNRRVEIRVLSN